MMHYKNYLEQSGIDLEQLEDNLEIIADHLFFLSRAPQGPSMTPVRPGPRPSTASSPSRNGLAALQEGKHR